MVHAPVQVPVSLKKHISILDALRGIAALLVVFYHYTSNHLLAKFESATFNELFTRGYLGVEIFFVVSGFVIPYSLWGSGYTPAQFGSYVKKRIARICPPAYASFVLILAQWSVIDKLHPGQPSRLSQLGAVEVFRNLTFSYEFLNPNWFSGVSWTLSIEFLFYLLIGFGFNQLFAKNKLPIFIAVFTLLTSVRFLTGVSDHSIFAYAPLFALGGATLLYQQRAVSLWVFIALLAFFGGLAVFALEPIGAIVSVATALIIAFVQWSNPVAIFFGGISYSLYLTHLLVGSTADFLLSKVLHPTTEVAHMAVILLCVAIACAVAYAFQKLIEEPFIKLAKRL